ncbi:glycoside hydrolase family 32 protein [Microbacterium sp. SSW1-49]|uniref:Glycoside hydrolase family 32 protein n=1 Tax=Microbacterium croceum TaxID=2851645 RepID=A0ABT0FCB4_9MICO|nr:glycoside hydrolase family 32 protein [Microbacterium croceum]MCK2035696.1 glycoside hydrolase family 32 protein [Microbacterium croceum]
MSSPITATRTIVPRPAFHFTPRRNWMNDPNGLVHDRGVWHLYFQYNPSGSDWGNMSWGHATSSDLQHWREHPVALSHRDGEQIFSGSVVATTDGDETSLTAFYTSAFDDDHQAQSTASSRDGGYTWLPDPANPILDRGTSAFRDPKVVRFDDPTGRSRWIMLTVEADDRQVLIYSSTDLRSWSLQSTFGPLGDAGVVWECPDLVLLPLDGDPDDLRGVLLLSTNPVGEDADADGSSMHYIVGAFDGAVFTPDRPELERLDHGRDLYAGVTFDSAPGGEAIMLGWMSNWRYAHVFPSAPWRGAMSLPRRLSLRTVDGAARLVQEPAPFVGELLAQGSETTVADTAHPSTIMLGTHAILQASWDPASTGAVRFALSGDADATVELDHDPRGGELRVTRRGRAAEAVHQDFPSTSAVPLVGTSPVTLLMSLDGPLLEVFVGDGSATASNLVVLGDGPITLILTTDHGGPITMTVADIESPERMTASARDVSA